MFKSVQSKDKNSKLPVKRRDSLDKNDHLYEAEYDILIDKFNNSGK